MNRHIVFLLIFFCCFPVSGQIALHDTLNIVPSEIADQLVLDQKIDPEQYVLGTGDKLLIFAKSIEPLTATTQILPDGTIFLPDIGVISIGNETLANARTKIASHIRRYVRATEVQVSLAQIKRFKVKVGGHVNSPGFMIVSGSDRAADVVIRAGLLDNSSQRQVQIMRRDTTILCDVEAFCRLGDVTDNPYVEQGDLILVPARDPVYGKISIYGAISQGGSIEYRPGDTLQKLLNFALGFKPNADSSKISIARFTSDQSDYHTIDISYPDQKDYRLQPDDRVMVYYKNNYKRKYTVEIRGEVEIPGFYAIEENKTTLADLMKTAGGITEYGSTARARLERRADQSITGQELERLNEIRAMEMNEEEREYWKMQHRLARNQVAVDFSQLMKTGNGTNNVLLRDGDLIVVPKMTHNVTVIGAVHNPGIQNLQPDQHYSAYIYGAGGYSSRARESRTRIIKGRSGAWLEAKEDILIEEGDIIFVPEKPNRGIWTAFRNGLTVATQIGALVALVYTISK